MCVCVLYMDLLNVKELIANLHFFFLFFSKMSTFNSYVEKFLI